MSSTKSPPCFKPKPPDFALSSTPNACMSETRLWNVSHDALAEILDLCDGNDICNVWFCGSKRLNNRISCGGVRRFALKVVPWTRIIWPQLLSSLPRLQHLNVDIWKKKRKKNKPKIPNLDLSWTSIPTSLVSLCLDLDQLPPGLSALSVEFANLRSFQLKFKMLPSGSSDHTDLVDFVKWFPILESLTFDPALPVHSYFVLHLGRLPPRLTSLQGSFGKVESIENGFKWPSSLQVLSLFLPMLSQGELFLQSLPPTLHHLELRTSIAPSFDEISDWSLAHLPHLETLELWFNGHLSAQDMRDLPRNLRRLRLPRFLLHNPTMLFPEELLEAVPPRLVELITAAHWTASRLPRTLTDGCYASCNADGCLDQASCELFPLGMRTFSSVSTVFPCFKAREEIQEMELGSYRAPCASIQELHLENLPPRLTRLTIHLLNTSSIAIRSNHYLHAEDGDDYDDDGDDLSLEPLPFLHMLPRTLTHLSSSVPLCFESPQFVLLPRGLLRWEDTLKGHPAPSPTAPVSCPLVLDENTSKLPPSLTKLRISTTSLLDNTWIIGLPRTITKLELQQCAVIDESCLAGLQTLPDLHSLNIELTNSKPSLDLTNMFESLPPRLTCCKLSHKPKDQNDKLECRIDHLSLLPRGLIKLKLPRLTPNNEEEFINMQKQSNSLMLSFQ